MILLLYNVGFNFELNCLLKPFHCLEGKALGLPSCVNVVDRQKKWHTWMFHDSHFVFGRKLLVTDWKEVGHITTYRASRTTLQSNMEQIKKFSELQRKKAELLSVYSDWAVGWMTTESGLHHWQIWRFFS